MNIENKDLVNVIHRLKAVAHDTRNLVSVLNGNLSIAIKTFETGNAVRGMELLKKSQSIAKIVSATISTEREQEEKICVNTILTEIASMYQIDRLIFRHDFHQGNVFIKGRYSELYRAFQNIVKNGIEAMKDNIQTKELHLCTQSSGEKVKIDIFNNGPHIPLKKIGGKETMKYIFDSGFTSGPGEGIGLASTRDLVASHKGIIGVTNMKEGGVKFTISFPKYLDS